MGNIRLSYFNNGSSPEILAENNFYPFGLKHEGYNYIYVNPAYNYDYNGKEVQIETGMLDYGWRQYMPELGRWTGMDMLSEIYQSSSPYAYVMNNPVMLIDPDCRKVIPTEPLLDNLREGGALWDNMTGGSRLNEFMEEFWSGESKPLGGGDGGNDEEEEVSSLAGSPFILGITGAFSQAAFDLLKQSVAGQLNLTFKNGIVSVSAIYGVELSPAAAMLLELINDPTIKASLQTVARFYFYDSDSKNNIYFEGDAFRGSYNHNGKTFATQIVSPGVLKGFDLITKAPTGTGILHAALEAYIGGKYFPGSSAAVGNNSAYNVSHSWAACLDEANFRNTPAGYRIKLNRIDINHKLNTISPYLYNKDTGALIYNFGTFKY